MRKLLIQIVDDEINVARTLQMVLEREGYEVTCANSARVALQQYRTGLRPDAAIIDLNMEREDIGLEVAAAAQRLKPSPVVVICTGYAEFPDTARPHLPRVSKPFDQTALAAAIEEAMRERADERAALVMQPKRA